MALSCLSKKDGEAMVDTESQNCFKVMLSLFQIVGRLMPEMPKKTESAQHDPFRFAPIGKVVFYNKEKGFGFVNGFDGAKYFFGYRAIEGTQFPAPGDDVEFLVSPKEPLPGKAPRINRLRLKASANDTESEPDDGKLRCPNCGKRVVPRVVTYAGEPSASYCPLCGGLIKEFSVKSRKDGEFLFALLGGLVFIAAFAFVIMYIQQ